MFVISVQLLNGDTELCHFTTDPVCPERESKPLVLPEQISVPPDTLPPAEAGSTVTVAADEVATEHTPL